jgi:hypothetical protein
MASLDFIRAVVWLVLGSSMLTPPSGATGWGLTLIAKAIGPLVTGAVMDRIMLTHPLRCGQIGAAGLALLTLALAIVYRAKTRCTCDELGFTRST